MAEGRQLRLAVFPDPSDTGENPYSRLQLHALADVGVHKVSAGRLTPAWVRRHRSEVDAVHLHWLEFIYGTRHRGPRAVLGAHRRALSLVLALIALRRSTIAVVWTVHNRAPHEDRFPHLTRWVKWTAVRASSAVTVHSAYAASVVTEEMRPRRAPVVIPHPNYAGAYPPPSASRSALRRQAEVPADGFAFLVFGQIRPYKRVVEIVSAFRELEEPDVRMIVAGGVRDPALERRIREAVAGDPRISLRLAPVSEQEAADLHELSDAAVLFHRDVFSSGTLMLALTLGLPVVGPADSTLDEIARPPAAALYGDDRLAEGLRSAMTDTSRAAARAAAEPYTWSDMATALRTLYERG